ncbi:hypothetical protein QQ41_09035 [Streptococcus equi subsp. zooepidemicus]|nr:hypothetical protein [Streptococcus equi]KIQ75247.1 hypothetical protein QQ41_09035 [Streptococcus equi subsp. zooepidemicus]MCD3368372.1 hypothetical protein [Streptococcus equi subsp. zooepidemicus]HEL0088997.1 hypothetical protein [Streptococcus equi subsp. zooepidemicus]HEL0229231.1 hypothetical protein [Streptococcus equi subsp. zooepidemicus]HEL0318655.1 hypothetical protein [Streptococcus equi subsp. zooepidemicus]
MIIKSDYCTCTPAIKLDQVEEETRLNQETVTIMIGKYECYARQLEKLAFVFNYNSELRTKDEWEKTI